MNTREKSINHYTIFFAMYLGMELEKDQTMFDLITGDDPELIESALIEWATEFVEKDLDDSMAFFDEKYKEYVHANYPQEDSYVYVVTGNSKNDDGSDEEWLVDIFGDEQRAYTCQRELQQQANVDMNDPNTLCDPVHYLVERRLVK